MEETTREEIEASRRNTLKDAKPLAYKKIIKYKEKNARGESTAIIDFAYDYVCNMRCRHCLNTKIEKKERAMTVADLHNIALQADSLGLAQFKISGGEPLLFMELDEIVNAIIKNQSPEYNFVAPDGFGHKFWVIRDDKINAKIETLFAEKVPYTYVADGHHRTAAAALVGKEKREANPNHKGDEEYNYFLAVHFPDNQLKILDYNRTVKDLNGLSAEEFLAKLEKSFTIECKGSEVYTPSELHNFSMYLDKKWYSLSAKAGTYNDSDPIGVLDVTILTEQILSPILDIQDLRRSTRIDFIGGIRGLGELKKKVDSGEMQVAFALYPVSLEQLIAIADSGNIMPPKTTWFEPKLRSGLVIHLLD